MRTKEKVQTPMKSVHSINEWVFMKVKLLSIHEGKLSIQEGNLRSYKGLDRIWRYEFRTRENDRMLTGDEQYVRLI